MIIKPEDRLAYIKKASAKFNNKVKRNARISRSEKSYVEKVQDWNYDTGANINAWTDPEKYVDEYYGDRAREQSSYESEWN
jgi:hypothetical protein